MEEEAKRDVIDQISYICYSSSSHKSDQSERILYINPDLYEDLIDEYSDSVTLSRFYSVPTITFWGVELNKHHLLEYDSVMEAVVFNGKIIDVKLYRLFKNEENER